MNRTQCKKSFGPKPKPLALRQPIVFTDHKPLATGHCRVQKDFLHSALNTWSRKIWAITALAALACLLSMGQAGAWVEEDLARLLDTKECEGCDLSGADLSGTNLHYAKLSRANLSGANLSRVHLFHANLYNADLSGADLQSAELINASLLAANLRDAKNVDSANFANADLSAATWTDGRRCKPKSMGECK